VTNPPYGERLGEPTELASLYGDFGDVLKRRAAGATAWLLVGNLELAKAIGLRASRRIVLFNGPIECRLLRFDLYEGSRSAPT
jgi:putative N6-adenine-specific DNA methylase